MSVSISCPQVTDAVLRTELHAAVRDVVKRFRPSFEAWRLSLFQSQSGKGWDLALSGPRFRKVFTLDGPADDLPGTVSAYVEAILARGGEAHRWPRRPNRELRTFPKEEEMAEDAKQQRRGPSDATDYSPTKAPETQQEAEEHAPHSIDPRLQPGGIRGTAVDPGMSSLDRDIPPSGGQSTGQQDIGATRNDKA